VLHRFCASAVRLGRRLDPSRESGFTLIEMLMSMVILMIVSTPLVMVMSTSVVTQKYNRQRTLAQQAVMQKVEYVRSLPYDSIGTVAGNPSGTVTTSDSLTSSTGLNATLTTQITYVNDKTPSGFQSEANYKKIVMTVTRNKDGRQLAKEATFISPPGDGTFSASAKGLIGATLMDYATGSLIPNVEVDLGTGPSAPRKDISDATGRVGFPQLTPNPLTGTQAYYDLTVPAASGWSTLPADVPPSTAAHLQVLAGPGQSTTLRLYKPGSINATLTDATMPAVIPSGVQVNLANGPSAPLTATSDSAGKVAFASLVPNPSGSFYDLSVGSGWTVLSTDATPAAPTHGAFGDSGNWSTSFRVYKAATINVTLKSGGVGYNSAATITISSPLGSQTFPLAAGLNGVLPPVTTFAGEPVRPNQTYTVGAQVSTNKFAPAVVSVVPASGYPGTTAQAFTLALNASTFTMRTLNVTVKNAALVAQVGARVDLTGGPASPGNIILTATTNASGVATFSVPDNTTATYNLKAYSGALTGTLLGFTVTGGTIAKTVTVN
jgi:prepilin-type N-terminal cleavage/methylation domain-containing protein